MNTYHLSCSNDAWRDALLPFTHLVPNLDDLQNLPLFAVVVVVDRQVLTQDTPPDVDELMQIWTATQENWQLHAIPDDPSPACQVQTPETLADVVVYRYLLLPTQADDMTAEKQISARHIIDEQLTAHLKKHLRPINPHQFIMDEQGNLPELDLSKVKTQYVDVHILSVHQLLNPPKLVCFDMDSTLIEQEVIVELAKTCGVAEQVHEITERAMRGELDFAQSFAHRVALLAGADASVVDDIIAHHISLQSGAITLIKTLKAQGCHTVLVSGGFEPFAQYVADRLGIHEFYANPLLTSNGVLTGEIDVNIIDGKQKAHIVSTVAKRLGLDMSDVACVGDGANDLPMMHISNIGIAYKAKPIVQARADVALNITGLEGVLYAFGHQLHLLCTH